MKETGTHNRQCLLCPSNACLSNKAHKCLISIEPLSAGFHIPVWASSNSERTRLDTYLLSWLLLQEEIVYTSVHLNDFPEQQLGANSSQRGPHSSASLIVQKHCKSRVSHPAPDVSSSGTFVKGRGAFYPVSTELNYCKAPCWCSLTSAPLSGTNTTFTSMSLLMHCRTLLSCIVLTTGIRGTAGHLLC